MTFIAARADPLPQATRFISSLSAVRHWKWLHIQYGRYQMVGLHLPHGRTLGSLYFYAQANLVLNFKCLGFPSTFMTFLSFTFSPLFSYIGHGR